MRFDLPLPRTCTFLLAAGLSCGFLVGTKGLAEDTLSRGAPENEAVTSRPSPETQPATRLVQLGADRWHRAGFRGQGVKVAVLDTGFRGYRAHLGKALPERIPARSFRADGDLEARDSQHGILCAEIVHAIAPAAELLFATWDPDQPEGFLQAAAWARKQGARILTCSLIMPSWSDGEGGGSIHAALAQLLGDGAGPADGLFFASAGNIAERHWSGRFRDRGDGWHEWKPGVADNVLTPWTEERVSLEMYWQPGADYLLTVQDAITGEEVGRSTPTDGRNRSAATVHLWPRAGRSYAGRVAHTRGKPGSFHIAALGGHLGCITAAGSIPFPADGSAVIAVGAVDEHGRRFAYSSCGPNSDRPKPDLVGAVPFPSGVRSRPFAGTSAAAPQAAALAALLWSRHPDWAAQQVRTALRDAARDLGPTGHDCETGFGLIRLP